MPIIGHDGVENEAVSAICPFCGEGKIEFVADGGYNFDDKGRWFKGYSFSCQNARCQKRWTEKSLLQSK
jgi:hypothetical protein